MPMLQADAAHLLRRAGFGGSPEEIEDLAARDRDDAVDHLINYSAINNQPMEDVLAASFNFSDTTDNRRFNQGELRRWWLTRMVYTRRQFEEKMTLFWHNHFATALSGTNDISMYVQNLKLRKHALDRFDDLLLVVSQDAAMLQWLDGISNIRTSPNENFSRELQELFTMGLMDPVTGQSNYTEDDVKEIARAFTGWRVRNNRNATDPLQRFEFFVQTNLHDAGAKTIYAGTPYAITANLGGEDVITIISDRPETSRWLVKELFDFFVFPLSDSKKDRNILEDFAKIYRNNDHSIKELVRAIFKSNTFFSERARYAIVKQPAEYVVGSIRMLGAQFLPGENVTSDRSRTSNALAAATRLQGQDIFDPPSVKGWDLQLNWIDTATMLERYNFANELIRNRDHVNPGLSVTNQQLGKYVKPKSKKTVNEFLEVLNVSNATGEVKKNLRTYLETNDQGNKVPFVVNDATIDNKIRGLVHQIMCLPEFQLN